MSDKSKPCPNCGGRGMWWIRRSPIGQRPKVLHSPLRVECGYCDGEGRITRAEFDIFWTVVSREASAAGVAE